MSLESWKAKFYPVPAEQTTVEKAAEHSLLKWRGLTKDQLHRHKPVKQQDSGRGIREANGPGAFVVNAQSCGDCPLAKHLGHPCDENADGGPGGPYQKWLETGDPRPMIRALSVVAQAARKVRKS